MRERSKKRLGEILVEAGVLTKDQLHEVLEVQKKEPLPIGRLLVQRGIIKEEHLTAAISQQLKVPYIPLQNYAVSADMIGLLDGDFCRAQILIAFDRDDKHIFLAMADPLNDAAIDQIEQRVKLKPQIFISTPHEILSMLDLILTMSTQKKELKKAV